ncbi:AfsR/SARP family transcriptional regulator [Pseudonocardia alni]|uniref:AfsR/SARP family transcriptional regulator n=1 Tax=Pseudonocardia alni TaxID=33907 RepID=UPI0033D8958E
MLGPLTLCSGNRDQYLASPRSGTVLAMLAMSAGRAVPASQLIEEVWPDKLLTNVRNALQANVKRLRAVLGGLEGRPGEEIVCTAHSGYLLDLPVANVDALGFLALADRGARLVDSDPGEAARILDAALGLWRGPAFFDTGTGPRLRAEATTLEERRLRAHEDLITAQLRHGAAAGPAVLDRLSRLVSHHPERERLVELQMLALYDDGRRAEALGVFHHVRRKMVDELGLEPGRALAGVYQAILTQDERLGERGAVYAARPHLTS